MIPPGNSEVSRVLASSAATDIEVTSLLSKLTPTVNELFRAVRKKRIKYNSSRQSTSK